jgi:glutathione S-transferase
MPRLFARPFSKKRQKNKKRILQTCLTQHVGRDRKFVRDAETALAQHDYLAGPAYSLADAAATPYITRLNALKLFPVWQDDCPRIIDWYDRIRARPSYQAMITDYLTAEDIARFDVIDDSTAEKAREILGRK